MKKMRCYKISVFVLLLVFCAIGMCAYSEGGTVSVSYLGPEGTYTEEASQLFFGTDNEFYPLKTVADAVDMMISGETEFAVIPQENTIGGPVYNYVDELLAHEGICIVGEIELPIRQALLAAEGTELTDITVVYSHAQGITQGAAWLEENLPEAEVIEVSSTAEGAKMVSESTEGNCAAIASTGAARVYGIAVLAENIQQNEDNKTRFYVLSDGEPNKEKSDRMVFTAAGDAEHLPALLEAMADNGIVLVSLHDRPEKTEMGRYIYLIECENAGYEEFEKLAAVEGFEFRYYGAFPVK